MKPISSEEITKIETFVNEMVQNKSEVKTRIMSPKEAVEEGALALFGEKYGDEVRVLSMGDEKINIFLQNCVEEHMFVIQEILVNSKLLANHQ